MLRIFNNLSPFFEDCYRRINVREYARIMKISPPSASKLLTALQKEGLLIKEEERNYIFYSANRESRLFVSLSRVYWLDELERSGLLDYLENECLAKLVILFGSLSKAEVRKGSDVDLAVFGLSNSLDLERFEKKLGREIQLFLFRKKSEIKSRELLNNILNGFIVLGGWLDGLEGVSKE